MTAGFFNLSGDATHNALIRTSTTSMSTATAVWDDGQKIFVDTVTGTKYRMQVTSGSVVLIPM